MIERIREADPALYEEMTQVGRRNIAMLTIAPTGTTSLMSQTTSGIEPVFRPVYKTSPQGQSDRQERENHLHRRGGRLVGGVQCLPSQVPHMAAGHRLRPVETRRHQRCRTRQARRTVALQQGDCQRHRLGSQGKDAGCHPEMGGPLHLGHRESAGERHRRACQQGLSGGLGERLQGRDGLPRRFAGRRARGHETQKEGEGGVRLRRIQTAVGTSD